MSLWIPALAYQLGLGGLGGFILGFVLKKISKIMMLLIGILLAALIYLGVQGIISVNYEALFAAFANLIGKAGGFFSFVISVLSLMPLFGSFAVGFLLGFKLG